MPPKQTHTSHTFLPPTGHTVTEYELRRLYRRFKKLDRDGSGTLTTDEFEAIPELSQNPLLGRLLSIFDKNKDEEIQFSEFVGTLATLSDKGSQDAKLRCLLLSIPLSSLNTHSTSFNVSHTHAHATTVAFQVYDIDGDGFISNGELFQVLKMMVGTNLNDVQLQQIVDKTIIEADLDKDGKISYEEFCAIIGKNSEGIGEKLTINWQ